MPCHNPRLSAYIPARALSRSTRLIVDKGIVNRTDFRSKEEKQRYGGKMYNFPAYARSKEHPSDHHKAVIYTNPLTYESSSPCTPKLSTALISIFSRGSSFGSFSTGVPGSAFAYSAGGIEKKISVSWSLVGSLKCLSWVDIVDMAYCQTQEL